MRFAAYLEELQHVADADEVDLVRGVLSDPNQTMAQSAVLRTWTAAPPTSTPVLPMRNGRKR